MKAEGSNGTIIFHPKIKVKEEVKELYNSQQRSLKTNDRINGSPMINHTIASSSVLPISTITTVAIVSSISPIATTSNISINGKGDSEQLSTNIITTTTTSKSFTPKEPLPISLKSKGI